jgi:hypothetical protein
LQFDVKNTKQNLAKKSYVCNFMKCNAPLFFVLVILMAVVSCMYDPHGQSFNVVEQPNANDIAINITEADDTVYLFTKTTLNFSAQLGNRRLVSITGKVGAKQIFMSTQLNNSFTLDPNDYETGIYALKIEILSTSGTGSLADNTEQEGINLLKDWVLLVDKSRPNKVQLTNISAKEGTLWIQWEKYEGRNFQSYVVEKYCFVEGSGFVVCGSYNVNDRERVTLNDSTFVSGKVRYDLRVKASDQLSELSSKEFAFDFDSDLTCDILKNNNGIFTWRPTPFYANMKAYVLLDPSGNEYFRSANVQDTSYTFIPDHLNFSTSIDFTFKVINRGNYRDADYKAVTSYHDGKMFYPFSVVLFNEPTNQYYLSNWVGAENKLLKVDGTTGLVLNSMTLTDQTFTLSPDGKILYVANNRIISQIDPETFQISKTFDIKSIKSDFNIDHLLMVSNNNVLILDFSLVGIVLDMHEFKLLNTHYLGLGGGQMTGITSDGEKYFHGAREFKKAGNGYVEGETVLERNDLFQIEYINSDTAVAISSIDVTVFNPTTGVVLTNSVWQYPSGVMTPEYDRASGTAYLFYGGSVYSYNIRDNSKTTYNVNSHDGNYYYLINHRLLCSNGFYLDLP